MNVVGPKPCTIAQSMHYEYVFAGTQHLIMSDHISLAMGMTWPGLAWPGLAAPGLDWHSVFLGYVYLATYGHI